MQKFLQWYKKSTKNKLIIFGIVFILSLFYSFLHRPLGLIMWYNISFIEEKERIETLKNYMVNEEKFLESYKQYNIAGKFYKSQKELFRYIDDFEIDLLASSFVGLSEWYLQSFLSKSKNYIFYFGLYITYQEYHDNTYTPENTAMFMEFLNKNEKISFFIDKLALNDEEFARYAIQQNILKILFIFLYISFLSQEQVCALPDREKILENLEQSNAVLQKELKNGNMIYEEMKQKSVGLESDIQGIFNMYNKTKDKLNECK